MDAFYQTGPMLGNQYLDDDLLQAYLRRQLGEDVLAEMTPALERMGHRAANDLLDLAHQAEAAPPRHVPYDAWGRRIDRIETHPAWDVFKQVAAEEGLVAMGYERIYGWRSRLCQFALLYLFHPSSAVYTCPLAMTDGAARILEIHGDGALHRAYFDRLTSRDPQRFWTSGQWMTERSGGSDVGGTATVARPLPDGGHNLHGVKWFTSATTSELAMTLARLEGAPEGSRGLSLFCLELRDEQNRLNHIFIHRLKDKLGTRALPTAELTLQGARASLLGGEGHGVRKISALLNITRIYNAVCALGSLRRGLALAKSYARQRRAFGKMLIQHPLHLQTLADLETTFRANFHLVFHLVGLLGKVETGAAQTSENTLLRLLTPVAKLFSAKWAVASASEVLECFGGAGYIEDTHLPALLRDAQVLSIWEGTTNILSLDCLRALGQADAFQTYEEDVSRRLAGISHPALQNAAQCVGQGLEGLSKQLRTWPDSGRAEMELGAREFAMNLARVFSGSLMLAFAQNGGGDKDLHAAIRWCERDPAPMSPPTRMALESARILGS